MEYRLLYQHVVSWRNLFLKYQTSKSIKLNQTSFKIQIFHYTIVYQSNKNVLRTWYWCKDCFYIWLIFSRNDKYIKFPKYEEKISFDV